MAVQQSTVKTASVNALITGRALLKNIIFSGVGVHVFTIYDSLTGSGTKLYADFRTADETTVIEFGDGVQIKTGISVVTAGTCSYSVGVE